MRRWLTLREVGDFLASKFPRVAKLSRKRRNEYALRLVRRMERREEARHTKVERNGNRILVSFAALEELLPADAATVEKLNTEFVNLHQRHRTLSRTVSDHSSRLRDHGKRIINLEEKQKLTARFIADMAAIDARTSAAE